MNRRGFLGRLFGVGAVAALAPSVHIEELFADVVADPFVPAMAPADLGNVSRWMREVYSPELYFQPFRDDVSPLLMDLEG